jgi:hypothetical protein
VFRAGTPSPPRFIALCRKAGYCLDDAVWGHGYATETARSLLQRAFDTLA